ncbi:MAG: single-stranded DNA-binding protein [Clostridia bacterium]|jgi:single-stranded DNA-binding protein|nr:single-stranded DNA-binding protein [Clostridia bacterium]
MTEHFNTIRLAGEALSAPVFDHEAFGEAFYSFRLSVPRLSGARDALPVTVSEALLSDVRIEAGAPVGIAGQIRSYNRRAEDGSHLVITVFARAARPLAECEPWMNDAQMTGRICRPVVYRTTPFSREISDILVAVGRRYGRSDYIPCIAWGRSARFAGGLMPGDTVAIRGRLQSREYQKTLPDGESEQRIAYELSCSSIELI